MAPTTKARTGATTAGISTLPRTPSPSTASAPAAAKAEPTTPPINACDELDGSPKYQVIRFQEIAPIKPAKTTVGVIASLETTSWAIVAATAREMNAPAKLSAAAYPTAIRGGIALVEIVVATTLAVSWNPFVKSNASAVPTTMTRMTSLCISPPRPPDDGASRVLDHDALEDVRRGLGRVDGALEDGEDVLPADHDHRVDPVREQRRDGVARQPVAVVFEPVDLDPVVIEVLEAAQVGERGGELLAGVHEHVRHGLRLLHRRLDLVQAHEVGGLLDEVDDVVELGGEPVDVFAVDWRDEGGVGPLDDVVRDPVTLLLGEQDLAREAALVGPLLEHLLQHAGGPEGVLAGLIEEIEEDPVARNEAGKRHWAGSYQSSRTSATRSAALPSHSGGAPGRFPPPARSSSGISAMRRGSRPSSVLVPARMVTGRSVLSRSVKQGI